MAEFSDKPWSPPTVADFGGDIGKYCAACMIDMNGEGAKTAGNCKLPYKEPSGAVNKNALRAIAAVLGGARGGVQASPDAKRAAARKTAGMMKQAGMSPGAGLMKMAGM